ncbi:DUF5713 family protein [Acinetobacter larvae]|uniref:Uncharacterized protein n=1 Tax=Acinetobacter larvae TaxID=1789224 RepID=A0A1B2LYX5_9GAMM|nr:DUF5713 family protein [Acinetobacter larvae]AOA58158.1 hypothetical protein BFG52_07175 [Acinetobacter larvae]
MAIQNKQILDYLFLAEMYQDGYYPNHLVDQVKEILLGLCLQIEQQQPQNLASLYSLTHAATEKVNDLQEAFDAADSEIETVARDCIGMDFYFIAKAYDFADADVEELIAPRDW